MIAVIPANWIVDLVTRQSIDDGDYFGFSTGLAVVWIGLVGLNLAVAGAATLTDVSVWK